MSCNYSISKQEMLQLQNVKGVTVITELNNTAPFEAELLETWTLPDTPTVRKIEGKVHRKLAKYHAGLSGFDGATEWFNTTPDRAKKEITAILINYAILNHTIANQPQLSLF